MFGASVPSDTDSSGAFIAKETSADGFVWEAKVLREKMSKSGPIAGLPTTFAARDDVFASSTVGVNELLVNP